MTLPAVAEVASERIPEWSAFLRSHFPGVLLPDTEREQISPSTARRFLRHLNIPTATFDLLRASSLLASKGDQLVELVERHLPPLIRVLPSRTVTYRRLWRGGFHGRLDVPRTHALWLSGQADGYVTLARRRDVHLPENIFLCSVLTRTARLLEELRKAQLLTASWAAPLVRAHPRLRDALDRSALRDITPERPTSLHLQAARNARHPCYGRALAWHQALFESLDSTDTETQTKLLAEGALTASSEHKRFELACLVRLSMHIESTLTEADGPTWTREHSIVFSHRKEIIRFQHPDGREIALFYDQAAIPVDPESRGQRDRGLRHYFGREGPQRPDITLRVTRTDGTTNYVVFEIKHSDSLDYIASGYDEAIVYRHEYAPYLNGWPKAVLVSPLDAAGNPRREDDVVAVGWRQLGEQGLIDALLDGVCPRCQALPDGAPGNRMSR